MSSLFKLPQSGRIACALCHEPKSYDFDRTRTEADSWRITNNPLAWGGQEPEIIVLGYSKGPTQAGGLERTPHDQIAFKGGRLQLAKILHHIGLIGQPDKRVVDRLIADPGGPIHFGSLIRCTVERYDQKKDEWLGTGGSMLDGFMATAFGRKVTTNCSSHFLQEVPAKTKLIVMLGMGTKLNYVSACRQLFENVRPGNWRSINDISYTDSKVMVVHVEHFKSQGALIPNWLGENDHPRSALGRMAQDAVRFIEKVNGFAMPLM